MKFKAGDKVRVVISDEPYGLYKGSVHTVVSVHPVGNVRLQDVGMIRWSDARFELVQVDAVLTPEEVFEHLRKGTKLQCRLTSSSPWANYVGELEYTTITDMVDLTWRIKPEPEVIELNGKKYREIID